MSSPITIRPADAGDLAAITRIYSHHVLHGLASFEETAPGQDEMLSRFNALIGKDYPYFVAETEPGVMGYAYAGPYRTRPAYRYAVENSVYVDKSAAGQGIGGRLLDALIEACTNRAFRQMIAVIGDSGNKASIGLHRSRGFRHVGTLDNVGFKHGRWVDSVFMQRALGDGGDNLPI